MLSYVNYKIEVIDEPFETKDGIAYPKTVQVTYVNEWNNIISIRRYGIADKRAIYESIFKGEAININNTFTADFSLEEYRYLYKLPPDSVVELRDLTAEEAFFECHREICIALVKFTGGRTSFKGSTFGHCDISFHKAAFESNEIDLSDVMFGTGKVNFNDSLFGSGNLTFENARFGHGDITFVNARFGDGHANFRNVVIGDGRLDFRYARFGKGDILFEKTKISGGKVDFRKVEFGTGKVDFRRVEFGNGGVSFEEAEFKSGKISFKLARFGEGDVSFELVNFGPDEVQFDSADFGSGKVSFLGARANLLSFKGCHFNNYLNLRVAECNVIDLSNATVRDIIDLVPLKEPVKIRELNMRGIHNLGRIYIDWRKNNVPSLILNQKNTTAREKSDQFRILKEDFSSNGLYNDEDKAYVLLKRMELKAIKQEALARNKLNALWVYPFNAFQKIVFDYMGGYATAPARVLASMLVTYSVFSLTYYVLPYIHPHSVIQSSIGEPEKLTYLAKSFYHSAVTFLTIGYGDYFPMAHARWISAIEGFVGLFLMAYFTVAFVRKILR